MSTSSEDEAIRKVAALLNDPHPGLLTWRAAVVKAMRELGFVPEKSTAKPASREEEQLG